MISCRADVFKNFIKDEHKKQWQKAWQAYTASFSKLSKPFEYDFEDIEIDGEIYSGVLHLEYSARFIGGTRPSSTDPGEPSRYEIGVHQAVVMPGEIFNSNDEPIYNQDKLNRLGIPIYAAIGADKICDYIENKLLESDR